MSEELARPLCGGRYRLVRVLGSGGAATVYRAYDALLGVWRAVKVLSPRMAGKGRVRERFLNEARTLARLEHPHIVSMFDIGVDGDRVYMVMESLDGGSLDERVRTAGPLPPRMATTVALAILSGLAEAHRAGVVHRDVKPHNVLISAEGLPKLIDFGIAQDAERDLTRTGSVIGTWAYMPPEQRVDSKRVDPRSDLYACGATLYALLTGNEPFDIFAREAQIRLFAGIPEPLIAILVRATRYDSSARYESAQAMSLALQAAYRILPPDPVGSAPLPLPLPPPDAVPDHGGYDALEEVSGVHAVSAAQVAQVVAPIDRALQLAPTQLVEGSINDDRDQEFFASPVHTSDTFQDEPTEPPLLVRVLAMAIGVGVAGLGAGIAAAIWTDEVPPPPPPNVPARVAIEAPAAPGLPQAPAPVQPKRPRASAVPASGMVTVRVSCTEHGGESLSVDAVQVGALPVAIDLAVGAHDFEVGTGAKALHQRVAVSESTLRLDLCPSAP